MKRLGNNPLPWSKRTSAVITIFLMVFVLVACESAAPYIPGNLLTYPTSTPPPLPGQEAAYAAAQATLAAGQRDLLDLSNQATLVSLNMKQAANVEAQATLDYYQRQLIELSIRGAEINQNMTQAAAVQQSITGQIQMEWDATANAQSQAATATYSAYILNVTQTAQVQANQDAIVQQTARANATRVAYSLTATPLAAIQSEVVRAQDESDRRALWDEFIVTPLKMILVIVVVVLLIVGAVNAYWRLMPVLELRLRTISHTPDGSYLLLDGMAVDSDPQLEPGEPLLLQPQLTSAETPLVEIVGPSEPAITNWITEAEQKLRASRRIEP